MIIEVCIPTCNVGTRNNKVQTMFQNFTLPSVTISDTNKKFIRKITSFIYIMTEFTILFLLMLILMGEHPNLIYLYSLILLMLYPLCITFIYRTLILSDEEIPHLVLLYLLISLFFIFIYSLLVGTFPLIAFSSPSAMTAIKLDFINSIYWASTTFTTLGYGDLLPFTPQAKVLSIFLSLTGTMHMVVFISLIFHKISHTNSCD